MKVTSIAFAIFLLATSCSFTKITERRTLKHIDLVPAITADILALGKNDFMIDELDNPALKRKLRKLHVKGVSVYANRLNTEFHRDSLIILSRYEAILTFREIIIDLRKHTSDDLEGTTKLADGVFYRRKPIAIS